MNKTEWDKLYCLLSTPQLTEKQSQIEGDLYDKAWEVNSELIKEMYDKALKNRYEQKHT